MTKQDWSKAPEDAQFYSCCAFRKHEDGHEYKWGGRAWDEVLFDTMEYHRNELDDFEMRPTTSERSHPAAACQYNDNLAPPVEWPASDSRIDAIGQNGGDGEHYGPEWIKWDAYCTHECPVPSGHDVEVRWRDGTLSRDEMPEDWNWYNNPRSKKEVDIIAYRDWTAFYEQQKAGDATMKQQAQMPELYPQYYKDCRHLDSIDVYGVHDLFGIQDESGCLQHASKKILLSGKRNGGKDLYQDIKEARDTLTRKLQLMEADK